MKKILMGIAVTTLAFVLFACTKKPVDNRTVIKIMHGALNEVDPFNASYSGQNQEERQDQQKKVEEELGVKVQYVAYEGDAGWGPARVNAIIEAKQANKPMADIYWTTSSWTSKLANAHAIVAVDEWADTHGSNIHENVKEVGSYQGKFYSFTSTRPTAQIGLYFNQELLEDRKLENPVEIYNRGEWNWTNFFTWATKAQAALSKDAENPEFVLGGAVPLWAQSLVPLNGGKLINLETGRVNFDNPAAMAAYNEIIKWENAGLREPGATYDSGSPEWQNGKVLIHPGSFWFLNAENRWGKLGFDLGFVPFPIADSFKQEDYVTPISGEAVYTVANQDNKVKEELAFKVWNALQLWKAPGEDLQEYKAVLRSRLREDRYVDAFLSIYDNVYLEVLDDLGIGSYDKGAWRPSISSAIRGEDGKPGDPRAIMGEIRPIYQTALDGYLGK